MSEPNYPYPKKRNEPREPKKITPPGMPQHIPKSPDLPPEHPKNLPPAQTERTKKKTSIKSE
jgi:hypothetical protein